MVTMLAVNAIRIKLRFDDAAMTGNYECSYCVGVLSARLGIERLDKLSSYEELEASRLKVLALMKTDTETPEPKIKRLHDMLEKYEVDKSFDSQMEELYYVGFDDKSLLN